jgi:single-strand DNA-binding protein
MLPTITGEFGVVFEPELRFNDKGNAWIKIRGAASDRAYNAETKEWEQKGETTYLDIIMGGKLAENLCESVTVGDQIVVTGELAQREWTTDEGEKRVSYQIRARSIGVGLVSGPAKSTKMLQSAGGGGAAKAPAADQSDEAPF